MNRIAALLLLALAAGMAWAATPDAGSEPVVTVEIKDGVVHTKAEVTIPASAREVWDVLTDFDNLSRYISSVTSSKVLSRDGNMVRVAQTGKAGFGPFTFEFQTVREVTLSPFEKFESRLIEGNMKRMLSTTRLGSDVGMTRIHYVAESVPDTVLPLGLARSTIESATRDHYKEMTREILRRKSLAATR
jgi:carbon monoxide dehydrogenase subunit G